MFSIQSEYILMLFHSVLSSKSSVKAANFAWKPSKSFDEAVVKALHQRHKKINKRCGAYSSKYGICYR